MLLASVGFVCQETQLKMPLKNGVLDDEMKPGRGGNVETIESFCDRHDACHDGKKWALENCSTMDDVWERAKPEWLIWVATRDGVLEDKTLRLFACFCARQIWPLLEDERSRNAVLVAEKFADGDATEDDLAAACAAAWDAARAAENEQLERLVMAAHQEADHD